MFASNAQGLGFSPQYWESKTSEKFAMVSLQPFLIASPEAETSPSLILHPLEVPETELI